MMNWLVGILIKESKKRRFFAGDKVRFLTTPRRGKGSTVLMPDFQRGVVIDYDRASNRYTVETVTETGVQINKIHPRNLMADSSPR